jgi:hypothetical protein
MAIYTNIYNISEFSIEVNYPTEKEWDKNNIFMINLNFQCWMEEYWITWFLYCKDPSNN